MKAVLWMMGALTSFTLMAIGARELSDVLPVFQTLLVRSVMGLVIMLMIIGLIGDKQELLTHRAGLHGARNIFHFAGQYGWFWGIGVLPLAEVFALEFTVPLWTAITAFLFLNEPITRRRLISILIGLIGVYVIVQPDQAIFNTASIVVILAAISYSLSYTATKSLSTTDNPNTILFYMCLVQIPFGVILTIPNGWIAPSLGQWLWLSVISVVALLAHYCLTKALQYADTTIVVTLDFLRLPLIMLVGIFLYNEHLEISLIIGGILMLTANLINQTKGRA